MLFCCIILFEIIWTWCFKLTDWPNLARPHCSLITQISSPLRQEILQLQKRCKYRNTQSLLSFSVIHDSTSCLLHLLLLAELFVHSSSRPANSSPLCGLFQSMIPQVERLMSLSKKLHALVRFHCTLPGQAMRLILCKPKTNFLNHLQFVNVASVCQPRT